MGRAGGNRNGEDPPNPFQPDARDGRNQRQSRRTSLRTHQSGLGQKKNLSQPSMRKKTNPNAPQHRPMSRPAEGRKEIPPTPAKTPKPKKPKKPKTPTEPTKKKWDFIGNQEYFGDSIVFEDAAPFNTHNKFFSIDGGIFNAGPAAKGTMLTLASGSFLNQTGTLLSTLPDNEGEYVHQCLKRLAQHLPPQQYKILPKDHSKILLPVKNRYRIQIIKEEKEGKDFTQIEFTPKGSHYDIPKEKVRRIGTSAFLDVPKRTKCLKAAVIDTDGALLEELFKAQKFSLQYRKIITTNELLQRFFENIHYWEVNDHKYLIAIQPNFETSEYTGIRDDAEFGSFGKRILPCTLAYGYEIPPFFRIKKINNFIDRNTGIQSMLTNELRGKMHAYIPYEFYQNKSRKKISALYCERVYSSFYASKTERNKGKQHVKFSFCKEISPSERAALYKGDDFIQCYKITKVSDDEIKVEQLKV